ncbi:protein of unknown function [Methylorubrum extorquens DM4]|uniref:Uncharacterized protein n=1 Tax=Methylorubrum extorquens (strain DSM 6343 / CIP 106787 / DM4) TaxID=661410 RepID=C7C847_METED|nr:protein of unknown function [Methylorubrum extorquens DM4]
MLLGTQWIFRDHGGECTCQAGNPDLAQGEPTDILEEASVCARSLDPTTGAARVFLASSASG